VKPQRGFALLEALAVLAIVALGAGALLMAITAAAKLDGGGSRNRRAAALLAAQTLRVAENAWKYGTPGDAPAGSMTASMPVPGSSATVPVTISSEIASQTTQGAAITVTVSYPPGQDEADAGAVTVSAALRVKAPLPGAQVERPGLVPQPAGTR
jgi:prepilin-type N-terminal cleavage/methylation domain-containing protein